jgi:hypothetical protein
MLRTILCCVLIAATSAIAWQPLNSVPSPADEENGSHITWGASRVWGLFPNAIDDATYSAYFDGSWHSIDDASDYALQHTGLTFQWQEDGVLFAIGNEDGDPYLYWYSLDDQYWDSDDLPFNLGYGACIAYQPNVNYNSQMNPVPGWIYCLPGQSTDFRRYAIPTSLPNVTSDGIYPCQGAVIAARKPLFQWSSGSNQYRLQVATDVNFSNIEIDEIVSAPECQVTTALANGTHYWHSAVYIGGNWSWSGTHNFELDGGWEELTAIPSAVDEGAAMAYDKQNFGHQSIAALVGGGHRQFYEYDIVNARWNTLDSAPKAESGGTSLTTREPTGQAGLWPWAAFGGSTVYDHPWYYNVNGGTTHWNEWIDSTTYHSAFPRWLGPGASMVCGTYPYMYLIVGQDASGTPRHYFYSIDPSACEGSQGVGVTRANSMHAHVISRYNDVEVEYQLCTAACVRATLHDAVGRQVTVLDAGEQKPGSHRLSWDRDSQGRKLSAGAYFVLLDMGEEQAKLKAVVR